jgi:pimeloyl-ACP methyl ester carboxylesterase
VSHQSLPLIEHVLDDFTFPWLGGSEPVVLLHPGLGGNIRLYSSWIPWLADRYRVLRVTARGQGGTERPSNRDPSLGGYAQDIVELLDNLGVEDVNWVGASGGGILGQHMAISHPHRIASLSLIATTARFRSPMENYDEWLEPLDQDNQREFLERDSVRRFGTEWPARTEWIINELCRTSAAESALLHRWIRTVDLVDHITDIKCPTLIVTGESDTLTSAGDASLMHDRIAGSRISILPGRPHNIAYTHPHEVAGVVRDFLDEIHHDVAE